VDELFSRPSAHRHSLLGDARSTNYGVVRLELIEHLYQRMYDQQRELGSDSKNWPHRILGCSSIAGFETIGDDDSDGGRVRLVVRPLHKPNGEHDEILNVDLVIAATGYQRQAHLTMIEDIVELLPESPEAHEVQAIDGLPPRKNYDSRVKGRPVRVGRDYGVRFAPGKVSNGSGIWLQGCCEGTHGVSVSPQLKHITFHPY
jgi:L-ornithine N5-monooxygenase